MKFCILMVCFAGLVLIYFYYKNKNRKIERYLIRHKKLFYILLQISYFILITSIAFNCRYVINQSLTKLKKYYKIKLKFF